ncbi:MAG: DUF3047 domain-containing protein [Nitrospira sp.]|nr:DUF3047 domain-containing protein [Nitrospira sp.]
MKVRRTSWAPGLAAVLVGMVFLTLPATSRTAPAGPLVLEDFKAKNADGFPRDWKAQRNESMAKQVYQVQAEGESQFLAVRKAEQRIYKKIAWDPKALPILTWRWRLKSAPAGAEPIAVVFVSLDTDLMVIPVANKYVWSATKAKGTMKEGGLFDASEIVQRTGPQPVGEWVEERVNAYEDFKRIHKHEPADRAWGISLLGGPGVEIDFGPIVASAP